MNTKVFTLLSIIGIFVTAAVYLHTSFATTGELKEVENKMQDIKYIACKPALHYYPNDEELQKRCFK